MGGNGNLIIERIEHNEDNINCILKKDYLLHNGFSEDRYIQNSRHMRVYLKPPKDKKQTIIDAILTEIKLPLNNWDKLNYTTEGEVILQTREGTEEIIPLNLIGIIEETNKKMQLFYYNTRYCKYLDENRIFFTPHLIEYLNTLLIKIRPYIVEYAKENISGDAGKKIQILLNNIIANLGESIELKAFVEGETNPDDKIKFYIIN